MFSNPIKYSSKDQINEFFELMSPKELMNLTAYIEGEMIFCENPQVRKIADGVYNITNYVGGAINLKIDDLRRAVDTYVKP